MSDTQLTDKGREAVRRMRTVFLPVRMALVLSLLTWPLGGPSNAVKCVDQYPFFALMALMIALERTGITADPSARSRDRASKLMLMLGVFIPLMLGLWLVENGGGLAGALIQRCLTP